MKKIFIFITLLLTIFSFSFVDSKALYINGVEYDTYTWELYDTTEEENRYNFRPYVDGNALLTNMTTWYSAIDNIYAVPHVYTVNQPMIFWDGTMAYYDGIITVYIDYDVAGASSSMIYFLDSSNTQIGAILMSDLTSDMKLFLITSNVTSPYLAGYNDGMREGVRSTTEQYENQIDLLNSQHQSAINLLETQKATIQSSLDNLQAQYDSLYGGYEDELDELEGLYLIEITNLESQIEQLELDIQEEFARGFSEATEEYNALVALVPQTLGVSFGFFLQVASLEVLGVSLLDVIVFTLTISAIVLVLKFLF